MKSQRLRNIHVTPAKVIGWEKVIVETDGGAFEIHGYGYSRVTDTNYGETILPSEFYGKTIGDVRCDGEQMIVQFENGSWFSLGWLTCTGDGQTGIDVLFHRKEDADAEFERWYECLPPCEEGKEYLA